MKRDYIIIFLFTNFFLLYSNENNIFYTCISLNFETIIKYNRENYNNYNKDYFFSFYNITNRNNFELLEYKKKENVFRRMEILFFGSLTIISFSGWLGLSIYNILIYADTFGVLRREQFLALYAGSCILSFSVAISDLFLTLNPKLKFIEFY